MNWEQLRAIIWLRGRLTKNQFVRGGSINAALSVIMIAILALAAVALAVGGFFLGYFVGLKASSQVLLVMWDSVVFGFLILWLSGLLVEIQRSESIDLSRLLHLPVTLQQVFVFNYVASHATPSIILLLPAMLAVCLGLTLGAGPAMALLFPVVLAFIFMTTAWTYCLRGWLSALMVNKRRRRAIIVWITIAFVVFGQLPNLVFNSRFFGKQKKMARAQRDPASEALATAGKGLRLPESLVQAHLLLPPGWVGYSAMALKDGNSLSEPAEAAPTAERKPLSSPTAIELSKSNALPGASPAPPPREERVGERRPFVRDPLNPMVVSSSTRLSAMALLPAIGATAVSCLLGILGLARAYHLTLRFYLADEGRKEIRTVSPGPLRPRRRLLVERRLAWLPDDTAALTLATLSSLMRAPELKMAAVMPIVVGAMLLSVHFTHLQGPLPASLTAFAGTAAAGFAVFSLGPTMANAFGLDRNGFRALVLLPTRRHHILLAKNLAFFPFTATIALLLLAAVKAFVQISWGAFVASLLQVPVAFLLFSLMCNFASILTPYRLAQGTLRAKKPKAIVFLAVALFFLLFPVLLPPLMIPAALQLLFSSQGWVPWLPVNLLATVVMLAIVAALYWIVLPFQGRLLQRREQTILREVTEETE